MVGCHRCGGRSREGARFCGTCGAVLGSARVGVRKTVTVLFADAVDVDAPAATTRDVELDAAATNAFYDLLRQVLERYGGTVERHIGDAVMAVFGVPAARDDDARRAVAAALELHEAVRKLPRDVRLGVGVNTGEVLTGDARLQEELAVGDPVVVAARLQQSAGPGETLVGPATIALVGRGLITGPTRDLSLRGREGAMPVVPVLGLETVVEVGPRGPFVGREPERRIIEAALQRTVETGIVQLVTVVGEAGTGKSRLMEEVLRDIEGVRVVRGHCREYGDGSSWAALGEILRDFVGKGGSSGLELLEAGWPELAGVRQVLASLLGEGDMPVSAGEVALAVARIVNSVARDGPLIVLIEDVHSATESFLDLVSAVVRRLDAARVAVVVTARPELLEHRQSWGRELRHVIGLTLRPLTEQQARTLAQHLLPEDPEGVQRVLAGAGGNPLFLEQLAQARREGAEIGPTAAPTVAAVLSARLDRLPVASRAVLERAALIGATGTIGDLAPLCEGLGEHVDVETELKALAARDLVQVQGEVWTVSSDLVREVAMGGIARDERADLHHVRGVVLGTRGAPAAAGFHLEHAANLVRGSDPARSALLAEQAASRLAAAGLRALSGDLVAACDLLGRATALLPPTSPRRMSLLTELARGLQLTGDLARSREVLEEAVRLSDEVGLTEAGAHARLALIDLMRSTEPERAYSELPGLLATVLPALEAAADDRGLSLAWQLQASSLQYRVRWAAMAEPLDKAMHHGQRSGDRRLVELAESLLVGSVFHGPMPLGEARPLLEAMLEQPAASQSHKASISARLAGAIALQGDPDTARARMVEVRKTFHDLGRELSVLATAFMSGPIEMLAGAPEQAVVEFSASCDGLQAMGDRAFASTIAALLAEAQWRCGNLDGAAAAVALSRQLAGVGDVISQVRWRCVQAKLHAVRRNAPEAVALSAEAVQMVVSTDEVTSQGDVLADAAEVQLLLGNRSAADVLLADALARYERKGATHAAEVARSRLT